MSITVTIHIKQLVNKTRALLYPRGFATHACRQSPYLWPALAATKPAILRYSHYDIIGD